MKHIHNSTTITTDTLAGCIDHTLLKPEADAGIVERLCAEAVEYGFASVCIHPRYAAQAAKILADQAPAVGVVVGFPLGANHTKIKQAEARQAIDDGAQELDMMINLAAALAGDQRYIVSEIASVLSLCRAHEPAIVLKVILETAALPGDTKIMLCKLLSNLGVDYLKTSTGMHKAGGATVEDVELLYSHRCCCRVKASGGIRTLQNALDMLNAGAKRIGTSAGVGIVEELKAKSLK